MKLGFVMYIMSEVVACRVFNVSWIYLILHEISMRLTSDSITVIHYPGFSSGVAICVSESL